MLLDYFSFGYALFEISASVEVPGMKCDTVHGFGMSWYEHVKIVTRCNCNLVLSVPEILIA